MGEDDGELRGKSLADVSGREIKVSLEGRQARNWGRLDLWVISCPDVVWRGL